MLSHCMFIALIIRLSSRHGDCCTHADVGLMSVPVDTCVFPVFKESGVCTVFKGVKVEYAL